MKRTAMLLSVYLSGLVVVCGVAEPIDECGHLWQEGSCITFDPFTCSGPYITDLDSILDSLLYTAVRIRGDLISCQQDCGGYVYRDCVVDAHVSLCEPEDLGCGALSGPHMDEYCYLWTSPIHGSLLVGLHGYSPGDTVGAIGVVDRCCATICMIGEGCLWNETFYICSDTTTVTKTHNWGSLKMLFR